MKKEKLLNAVGQIDDKLIADANPETRVREKKVRYQRIVAFAACLILIICASIAVPVAIGNTEAGTVTMEINPGVEYTIARNGNVRSVRFLNDDAKNSLEEVTLKGQSLKTAVALTIAAYKTVGYMEKNDTVLISFNEKLSENAKLKESVSEYVRQALEKTNSVHTLVYVSVTETTDIAELAEKYNISHGKAKLIGDAAENSGLPVEDLVKLPLDELVGLQNDIGTVVVDSKYIGISKAKAIALLDAGCANRVVFTDVRLVDDGVKYPYYYLVFNDNHTRWTYYINAINGNILDKFETAMFITLEEARAIALKDAGIDETVLAGKVIFTKEELSRNQGRPCWILEFYTSEYQYSYKIDAKTGEIFYFEYHIDIRKAKEIAVKDAGVYEEFAKITFTTEEYVGGGIKTPYFYFVFNNATTQWTYRIDAILGNIMYSNSESMIIPLQKAKEIALLDAGISESEEVVFITEVLSRNQGRPCWILEFLTEKYRYNYKIDAKTGEIIFNTRYINISKAKEIAVLDSGCIDGGKIVFTAEELVDGGIKTPYYFLEFNDDVSRWTYHIDAVNGGILFSHKESMMTSLQKAKEIALLDADLPESVEVVFITEVLSRNHGRPCWILEFYTEKYLFCYKIDATTGEILDNSRFVYIERARETALLDSGCSGGGKIVFTAEELVSGGIKTPYYFFEFNDGTTRWTYRIDATNGQILSKMQEPM